MTSGGGSGGDGGDFEISFWLQVDRVLMTLVSCNTSHAPGVVRIWPCQFPPVVLDLCSE